MERWAKENHESGSESGRRVERRWPCAPKPISQGFHRINGKDFYKHHVFSAVSDTTCMDHRQLGTQTWESSLHTGGV